MRSRTLPSTALLLIVLLAAWAGCSGTDEGTSSPVATTATSPIETTRDPARPTSIPSSTLAPAVESTRVVARGSSGSSGSPGPAGSAGPGGEASPAFAPTAMTTTEGEAADSEGRHGEAGAHATPAPAAAFSESVPADSAGAPYQPVSLSAGEVDDNERWEEYQEYLEQYAGSAVHKIDVSERYIISVVSSTGRPVPDAVVEVSAGERVLFEGRTLAEGRTLFFPGASSLEEDIESFVVSAQKDGVGRSLEFTRGEETEWQLALDMQTSYNSGVPLDVLFLLDSTGSMADEIDQIKTTLLSIAARISDLPAQPDLRFGMVSYRDRGDEYVTRLFDFDEDVGRFSETIRNVRADGGGDTPESLNESLHVAIHRPEWRTGDAVRLVFLLADAPPHLDYQDDFDYAVEMVEARRRGIKIFSVASSGLDAQGEYIFRQIAQHTMGRFIFLLYAGYGEGLGTPHNVAEYTVENLDDLIVRLIEEELVVLSSE